MTELQNKEFELLCKFNDICEKLNLQYYLVCGTALGAVKYKGFIPWDDDVDVGMPRKDYEIFITEAGKFLEEPYFLQNYKSDKNFPMIYSKLRNSNTTYIEKSSAHLDINHGIYIDIFPLDGYPANEKEQNRLEIKKNLYSFLMFSAFNLNRRLPARILTAIVKLFGFHRKTAVLAEKYTRLISAYTIEKSDLICNHGNWQGKLEYAKKEQYGNGTFAEFEGLRVRIPEKYDEYLFQKYGNWREDLPKEQQVGHHYYEICDLEKPYVYYKKS